MRRRSASREAARRLHLADAAPAARRAAQPPWQRRSPRACTPRYVSGCRPCAIRWRRRPGAPAPPARARNRSLLTPASHASSVSSALPATISAAPAFMTTTSRKAPSSPFQHGAQGAGVFLRRAAEQRLRLDRLHVEIGGLDLERAHATVLQLGDIGDAGRAISRRCRHCRRRCRARPRRAPRRASRAPRRSAPPIRARRRRACSA